MMLRLAPSVRALARKVQAPAVAAGQRSFFGGGDDVPSDPKELVPAPPSCTLRCRRSSRFGTQQAHRRNTPWALRVECVASMAVALFI